MDYVTYEKTGEYLFLQDDGQLLHLLNGRFDKEYFDKLELDNTRRLSIILKTPGYHTVRMLLIKAEAFCIESTNPDRINNIALTLYLQNQVQYPVIKSLSKSYGSNIGINLWKYLKQIYQIKERLEDRVFYISPPHFPHIS